MTFNVFSINNIHFYFETFMHIFDVPNFAARNCIETPLPQHKLCHKSFLNNIDCKG